MIKLSNALFLHHASMALLLLAANSCSPLPAAPQQPVSVELSSTKLPLVLQRHRCNRRLAAIPYKTCYEDILPLSEFVPSLARDVTALMLTNARLNLKSGYVEHLQCNKDSSSLHFIKWPRSFTGNQLLLRPLNSTAWAQVQKKSCTGDGHISGLAVAIGREDPLNHFGHRMLTDLPALYALRSYLVENGVDVSHVHVIFTDKLGQPAWGPDNFKLVLHSLGFKSYEPYGHNHTVLCFDQVVFLPHYYYPKWWTDAAVNGTMMNMWQAPADKLYDIDPFHMKMIGQIRAAAGLPATIPFAPASNRTIVVASRDREIRNKHHFRTVRILENEDELLKALQALPGIHVLQVELGVMPMKDILQLLEKTSLFLGYHGAAFDNCVFLPRGASVLEILPKGTNHPPLYPALAHRTGKEFARYVNDDDSRQICRKSPDKVIKDCLSHYADLVVNVDEVVLLVKSMLHAQAAAMTRYSFDTSV